MSRKNATHMHAASAPLLFVRPLVLDGVGTTVSHLLYAAAYAASRGFNFGGAVGSVTGKASHGVSESRAIAFWFGGMVPVVPAAHGKGRGRVLQVHTLEELDAISPATLPPATTITCSCAHDFDSTLRRLARFRGRVVPELLLPLLGSFTAQLRLGAARSLAEAARRVPDLMLGLASGRPRVALHVRRGDIHEQYQGGIRWEPDETYYRAVEAIRAVLPTADVHVFSETSALHPASEFRGYLTRGMRVHLNGDPFVAWSYMAMSHILVQGRSGFSFPAAAVNPGCVFVNGIRRPPPSPAAAPGRRLAPETVATVARQPPHWLGEWTFNDATLCACARSQNSTTWASLFQRATREYRGTFVAGIEALSSSGSRREYGGARTAARPATSRVRERPELHPGLESMKKKSEFGRAGSVRWG